MAGTIHTAINEIMKEVGYVQKKRSPELRYTYAGEAALIEAVRPVMVEKGVYMYVEDVDEFMTRDYQTKTGTAMVNITMRGRVRFVHAESGTSILVTARGEGSDSGDKASNKALTGLYKYALRQTFCIETGDDPDQFASDERSQPMSAPTKPAAKPAAKPAPSMVEAAQELGAVEISPELQAALDKTTSKGTRYGNLNDSQLEWIINDPASKAGKDAKHAAQVVLDYRIANGITK